MKHSLFSYKGLSWVLTAIIACCFYGDIQSSLPGGREVLIQKRLSLEERTWQITLRQHYEGFAEPYRVVVEVIDESSGQRWEEQLAFEEPRWDGECFLKLDVADGTISIVKEDLLFAVLNLRNMWLIDGSGNKYHISQD